MKKTVLFVSLLGFVFAACNNAAESAASSEQEGEATESVEATETAEGGDVVAEEAVAPKTPADFLPKKAEIDSVSYLLGVNFGSFLRGYNFGDKLNYRQIVRGIKDFMAAKGNPRSPDFGAELKHSPNSITPAFNAFLEKRRNYVAAHNKEEGEKFFAKNAAKPGVETTESGLQYKIVEPGSDVKPGPKDTVWIRYKGTLLDGTVFDQSPEGVDSVRMMLPRLIKGWQEGLQLIGEGGEIELYIPSELGYGERGSSNIEANSALIFNVELRKVNSVPPVVEEAEEETAE